MTTTWRFLASTPLFGVGATIETPFYRVCGGEHEIYALLETFLFFFKRVSHKKKSIPRFPPHIVLPFFSCHVICFFDPSNCGERNTQPTEIETDLAPHMFIASMSGRGSWVGDEGGRVHAQQLKQFEADVRVRQKTLSWLVLLKRLLYAAKQEQHVLFRSSIESDGSQSRNSAQHLHTMLHMLQQPQAIERLDHDVVRELPVVW